MEILATVFFNVIFGFLFSRTWSYSKFSKEQGITQCLVMKIIIIGVVSLCIVSFFMQIILLLDGEFRLAAAMQLLACVLMYVFGNLIKPQKLDA